MNLIERNRTEGLYILHTGRIVYIPQGWGDFFDDPAFGGPSFIDDQTGEPRPELYGHGYVGENAHPSGFDTIYWNVASLEKGREVTETEARTLDPALFAHLDRVNGDEV